jgi:hypothetical protein
VTPTVPYARRIRGERRVEVKAKVREATRHDLVRMAANPVTVEATVSQLLRRYIQEGLERDRQRSADHT